MNPELIWFLDQDAEIIYRSDARRGAQLDFWAPQRCQCRRDDTSSFAPPLVAPAAVIETPCRLEIAAKSADDCEVLDRDPAVTILVSR
jgi:hypothetical protein